MLDSVSSGCPQSTTETGCSSVIEESQSDKLLFNQPLLLNTGAVNTDSVSLQVSVESLQV